MGKKKGGARKPKKSISKVAGAKSLKAKGKAKAVSPKIKKLNDAAPKVDDQIVKEVQKVSPKKGAKKSTAKSPKKGKAK